MKSHIIIINTTYKEVAKVYMRLAFQCIFISTIYDLKLQKKIKIPKRIRHKLITPQETSMVIKGLLSNQISYIEAKELINQVRFLRYEMMYKNEK